MATVTLAGLLTGSADYTINGVTISDPVWRKYLTSDGHASIPGVNIKKTPLTGDAMHGWPLKQLDGSQVIFAPNDDLSAVASGGHLDKKGNQISRIDFNGQSQIVDYAGSNNQITSGDGSKQTGAGAKEDPLLGIPDAASSAIDSVGGLISAITNKALWVRIGIGAAGVAILLIAFILWLKES